MANISITNSEFGQSMDTGDGYVILDEGQVVITASSDKSVVLQVALDPITAFKLAGALIRVAIQARKRLKGTGRKP